MLDVNLSHMVIEVERFLAITDKKFNILIVQYNNVLFYHQIHVNYTLYH